MTRKKLQALREQVPLKSQWILKAKVPAFFQLRPNERVTVFAYDGSDVGLSARGDRYRLTITNLLYYFECIPQKGKPEGGPSD